MSDSSEPAGPIPIVVASDPGAGFESSRWLMRWGNPFLLDHVLGEVRRWDLPSPLLILGADAETVLAAIDYTGFTVIIDPEWKDGFVSTLRTGFDYLLRSSNVEMALVVDAARPSILRDVIDGLLDAAEETDKPVIVPKYRYSRGEPILIARRLWSRLVGVDRTATLIGVLETHPEWVEEVWFDQVPPAVITDPGVLSTTRPGR